MALVSFWRSSSTCFRRECLNSSGTGILWGFLSSNRQCQSNEGHFVQPNGYFEPLFTACRELYKVLFLSLSVTFVLFVNQMSQGSLNGFAPNSHRRRIWSLSGTSLNVKVKGQGHQGQKTAFFVPFGGLHAVYVW